MNDWAEGDAARNYEFRQNAAFRGVGAVVGVVLFLAMISGVILFHIWTRSQITSAEHQVQRFRSEMDSLARSQGRLIKLEQDLKSPDRIDRIARSELGMRPLDVRQILPTPLPKASGLAELRIPRSSSTR